MTKDEALRMAIEALEMHVPYYVKDRGCDAIQACKEALAETQEAIGYVGEVGIDTTYEDLPCGTKLYTTPPRREWFGLSDDEIDAIFPLGDDVDVLDVARGIEAKLRIKNGY